MGPHPSDGQPRTTARHFRRKRPRTYPHRDARPRKAFGAISSILFTYRLCARVSALGQSEVRQLLVQRWIPPDLALLKVAKIDPEAIATIIRVTNGNFRLLHRLLTQIERILEINSRIVLTKGVVEAARETLVLAKCKAPSEMRLIT